MKRRTFITMSAFTSLALAGKNLAQSKDTNSSRQLAVFTKNLEHLPFPELAKKVSSLGISGIEAPLRKGGHIEPEKLADELPSFVSALKKENLKVSIMASSINHLDKGGLAEKQLRAAAAVGIKKYRLAYFRYDLKQPIQPQLDDATAKLKDLCQLNEELGIEALYQNHRGSNFVGAPIWDIVQIIEKVNSPSLKLAFDFAHATVEGANAWQINFRRALPHIGAVYMKDYAVTNREWSRVPLGKGVVSPATGKLIKNMLPANIPISLHIEYIKGKNREAETLAAMKQDLDTLRDWMK